MKILAQTDQEILVDNDQGLIDACGSIEERRFTCEWVYSWTNSESWASVSDWMIDHSSRVALILVLAWLTSHVAKRAIVRLTVGVSKPVVGVRKSLEFSRDKFSKPHRSVARIIRNRRERKSGESSVTDDSGRGRRQSGRAHRVQDPLLMRARERALARAETLGRVLRSLALATIWSLAIILVLGEIGVNLGPLIAGAGIAGIALGFGAQSVVKDFLSGLFMLMEDNYGVGDMVDFGGVMGNVIDVTLRSTSFKDRNGVVWHVPNGQIEKIGNFSQLGLRARLNIPIAYNTDLRLAIKVTNRVGQEMWRLDACKGKLAEPPSVSGIQDLDLEAVIIRVIVETLPGLPWRDKRTMERMFRLRLKEAYDEAGIEIPFPQRDLWIRNVGDTPLIQQFDAAKGHDGTSEENSDSATKNETG